MKVTNKMPIMIEPFTRRPISSTMMARPETPSHRLAECMRFDCRQQHNSQSVSANVWQASSHPVPPNRVATAQTSHPVLTIQLFEQPCSASKESPKC